MRPFALREIGLMGLGGVFAGLVFSLWLGAPGGPAPRAAQAGPMAAVAAPDTIRARFGLCHSGGGIDCVVDGDTFWLDGEKIRIADIDAPETHPPRCAEEERLGNAATARLRDLLNAGPITLAAADRDTDRYGRKLRIVTRGAVAGRNAGCRGAGAAMGWAAGAVVLIHCFVAIA
ncbi:thermonuclease family protein [Sphingomonas sp. AOB5]|uniref:thermonuclease family protein n=1 Tax=Sphingomonas sp. AOB5 TaxID=3034017 RepID=UPI003211CCA9